MSKTKEKLKLKVILIAILALAIILSCICFVYNPNIKTADAFSNATNVNSQSTNLGELMLEGYDTTGSGKVFDAEVFWPLVELVTGVSNPNTSTLNSWNTVRTATQFRTANSANRNLDLSVTINGLSWTPTYLSYNSKNEPILTFWLSTNTISDKWNTAYQNSIGKYPSNMYGTSWMRASILNNGGSYAAAYNATTLTAVNQSATSPWANYTMAKNTAVGGSSIKEFLEVPDNMSWQHSQSAKTSAGQAYDFNNDSLDSGGSYDAAHNYYTHATVNTDGNHTSYQAWKNDTLWLPSVAEVGCTSGVTGLWQTSVNQRASSTYSWLRSADYGNYYCSYRLAAAGTSMYYGSVTDSHAVRPAFHLNLKSAGARAGSLGAEPPTDVESVYNGQPQTLADVSSDQTKWYDSTKITLSYPSGMTDAGTYQVTAKISDSALAEDPEYAFKGDPDTSKGEDAHTRVFNFTIKKKKIGVIVALDTGGMPVVSLKNSTDVYTGDDDVNGRAPKLAFNYTSINGYNDTVRPTAVGTYTATAIISNASCNYELDNTYSINFTINKKDVPKPAISGQSSKQYTGEDITFTMTGGDNPDITIELPAGMTRSGNTLSAKNAGVYKVVCKLTDNGVATQWPDGTSAAIELTYEITKKPLTLTISSSISDFTWNVGDRPVVTIVGDSYENDSTELYIYYIDNNIGSSIKYDNINDDKVITGKTRTITMPGDIPQGSYTICVELYGSNKDNDNYSLAAIKTQAFTVKGQGITMTDAVINWNYNNIPIGNPTTTYVLTYTGTAYRFGIDDSVLASHGVKIDISKGNNGYSGDVTATNAKSGLYSVTVYLTNYDSTYESYNAQYTLYYQIDKAKYDLSGLTWPTVSTLEYNGSAQGMELQGTLPAGLQATYSGNNKVPVGSYSTSVTFSVSANYVNNYYVPTAGAGDTYTGSFDFTYDWSIIKATLNASWKDDNVGDSEVFKLPTLRSVGTLDLNSMVDYTYYDSDGNEVTSLPTQVTEEMTFKAVAKLKSAFTSNYQFANGTDTTDEYVFVIGKDKYPVTLILKYNGQNIDGARLPYTGNAYAPTIEITKADGGILPVNITLTYFKDSSTSGTTDAPTQVGKYRVEATLNYGGDLNYIEADSAVFEFEIIKADFDVSSLQWQYSHGDVNAVYDFAQGKWLDSSGSEILPFTYDTTAHTLTLAGKDNIAGLSVSVTGNEQTDAGTGYSADIVFSYDNDNYNAPNFPTSLVWSIAKAGVDTSGIVWGYTTLANSDENAYVGDLPYTRLDGGGVVHYIVSLINVPDILKSAITYKGDNQEQSEIGIYAVEYTLADLGSNYEPIVMPSGLQSKLTWTIVPKTIAKPVFDGSWTVFDGEEHDFAQMFGITVEGWYNYMTMTITKDGETYEGIDGDGFKAFDAGMYVVKFDLIIFNENNPNVKWDEWPDYEYNIKIKAYEIDVKSDDWQGNNTNAEVPMDTWVKRYVGYRYLDEEGNTITLSQMQPNTVYYKELYALEGYEDDILIYGEYRKTVTRPGSIMTLEKPVFDDSKTVTYNGSAHTIEDFLRKPAESGVKFEVDGDLINAGEYTVTISIDPETFVWEDGTTDSYTVTVKVDKAVIPQNRLTWVEDSKGVPMLSVSGYDVKFTYTYYDADGFELTADDIANGLDYAKVVAKLDDNNFEVIDANKEVLEEITYDPSSQGGNNGGNKPIGGIVDFGNVTKALQEWWQVIASVISILIIVICLIKGIGFAKKKKKDKKDVKNKYSTTFYASMATGLFGWKMDAWTAIACTLMGLAVASIIFAIIEKSGYNKAESELETAKAEFDQAHAKKKEEDMRMMMMGVMGANSGAQGAGFDMGAIRGMINDAMASNVQQLPDPSAMNNEFIERLMEQNAQNEERLRQLNQKNEERIEQLMQQLAEQQSAEKPNANDELMQELLDKVQQLSEQPADSQNDEVIKKLMENQDMLMKKLEEQPIEKIVEREVASANANDELMQELIYKVQQLSELPKVASLEDDGIIQQIIRTQEALAHNQESLAHNQEALMKKIEEQSVEKPNSAYEDTIKQIVKNQEMLMKKVFELSANHNAQPQVVEKQVVKEVPVERVVEKVVEKDLPAVMPVMVPRPKKEVAPRLTLKEAYAKLTKQQQKFFDGLREYAMSKDDKCKEKMSTYFTTIGPSTVNPLIKLTIKKNTAVALFKMEDEYMKDIRRNATNDGAKIKIKETEVLIADAQAFNAAKEMIDLRVDQIERYADYLREQRAMKN